MWDLTGVRSLSVRSSIGAEAASKRRLGRRPLLEGLEERRLMAASLLAIKPVSVPALQGTTVPLMATSNTTDAQVFTVSSSNPDISVSTALGPFWTVGVSYTDSTNAANDFAGNLTFDLLGAQTPNTVSKITQFTNDDFYVNSGKYFPRIVSNFDGPGVTVLQGGSTNNEGTGSSGQAGTPFSNENVQELALTGTDQIALANAGGTDTNDTQFFINTGATNALGYNYTVFGQEISGQATLAKMSQISVQANPDTGEDSQPVNALTITSTSLSATNPNGAAIIDATQAKPGETATITVTATDPTNDSSTTQAFVVTVGPYSGPTTEATVGNVNFKPYASSVAETAYESTPLDIQLLGTNTYPDKTVTVPLTYSLTSQPADGRISDFDATTGTFVYTPNAGYAGADTFQYTVTANGPDSSASAATSNPATVTITDSSSAPPLSTVQTVTLAHNKRNQLTGIQVNFSQPVNAAQADETAIYHLVEAGSRGSFKARNAEVIRLSSAIYSASSDTVTVNLKKPMKVTKALQFVISGTSPYGLEDSQGRYLDGANNGQAGSDAVISISPRGVTF